jgi:hypothetical protein
VFEIAYELPATRGERREDRIDYFTESDDWISFSGRDGDVEVKCSYLPDVVVAAGREQVWKGVRSAGSILVDNVERHYPEIASNAVFFDIASRMRV